MATPLHTLSEPDLIRRVTAGFALAEDVVQGIGDDCAVLDTGGAYMTLLSTDALVEGVHFDPFLSPMPHIGFKAVSTAVSDVYAMFGRPTAVLVSIGLSQRFTVEHLEEIYTGIRAAADYYGVSLVGGDTTRSLRDLFLSVTVVGEAPRDQVVYRTGAQRGDILCVSRDLGAAYAGLLILQREGSVLRQNREAPLSFDGFEYVVEQQLRPVPSRTLVASVVAQGVLPTACIDLSDGLASELYHLSEASTVGFTVVQDQLPVHPETEAVADRMNLPHTTLALYGGEEYGLLCTVSQADFTKLNGFPDLIPIGYATEPELGVGLLLPSGDRVPIERLGYAHFAP